MRGWMRPEGRALGAWLSVLALAACGPEVPRGGSGVKLPALGPSTLPVASPSVSAAPPATPPVVVSSIRPSPSPEASATPSSAPASPSPTPSSTVALALGAEAPRSGWRPGPDLRRGRFGLGAGELDGQLVAFEGDVRPGLERYEPGAGWQLDEAYGPQGTGLAAWGWRFMAVAARPGGVALLGGEQAGPSSQASAYGLGGPSFSSQRLTRPTVGAAGGATSAHALMAGGESPREELATNAVFAYPWSQGSGLGVEESRAPMPHAVAGAAGAMVDGKFWVLGGYVRAEPGATPTPTTHVQVYDPVANTWLADGQASGPPPLPQPRHGGAACFVGGRLWLMGGAGAGGGLLPGVDSLVPGATAWVAGPNLPTPRVLLAVAVYRDEAWAIGGLDARNQALRTVEVLRP